MRMRGETPSQPHLPTDARPFAWTNPAAGRQGNKGQQLALLQVVTVVLLTWERGRMIPPCYPKPP